MKKANKRNVISWWLSLFLLAGILFFLYVLNCGINYHRNSFAESTGIGVEDYTSEELRTVCEWLTREVNRLDARVERNADGLMMISNGVDDDAVSAMTALGEVFPQLDGYYPRPKGLLFPALLSVQHLSGIYSPFTVEANYNTGMTDYNIPFTACHELSHLRGFMQEEEANFIAFLACIHSTDDAFQYSGFLSAWSYCMNALYRADYDAWEDLRGQILDGVEVDLKANRQFWANYDGSVAEVANQINDTYLKANGQEDGVTSYGRMVDLIVACYGGETAP